MNPATLRLAGAALLVYVALQGNLGGLVAGGGVGGPYAGRLADVHAAAASMAAADRKALSEAMEAAGEMLLADKLGLVATTEELQRYVKAATEFSYLGVGKPTEKYPAVARAIQAALDAAIGTEVAPVNATKRAEVAAVLSEAGKAVR